MHILIGLVIAAALLYFWLVGHWFARILMFLVLGAAFFIVGMAFAIGPPQSTLLGLCGVAVAWFVAGLPVYYWRRRMRVFLQQRPA